MTREGMAPPSSRRPLLPGMATCMMILAVTLEGAAAFTVGFVAPMEAIRSPKVPHIRQSATRSRPSASNLCRLSMTTATASNQDTNNQASTPAAESNYGPHIKVGKKGAILNLWGLWIMTYSVALGLIGYLYLKIRVILGALTLGLLKPTAEHCCWIMHMWCKIVLWIGMSNPKVKS
jgi:hypothetical protein